MSPPALLTPEQLSLLQQQAAQLSLQRNSIGSSRHSGPFSARRRGSGLELEELRHYQFGDDVRHMAWRASARSATPIMKVFRAEQQTRLLLVIEQHPGMLFGTQGELKAALACRVAALLGLAAQRAGAEVGAVIPGRGDSYFSYSNRRDTVLTLIQKLNHPTVDIQAADPAPLFEQLTNLSQRGERIILISDFAHWNQQHAPALARLADHAEVNALQIIDHGEQQLPAQGRLRLRSPYDGSEVVIDSDNSQLRERYNQVMRERQAELEHLMHAAAARHLRLYTDEDPLAALGQLL